MVRAWLVGNDGEIFPSGARRSSISKPIGQYNQCDDGNALTGYLVSLDRYVLHFLGSSFGNPSFCCFPLFLQQHRLSRFNASPFRRWITKGQSAHPPFTTKSYHPTNPHHPASASNIKNCFRSTKPNNKTPQPIKTQRTPPKTQHFQYTSRQAKSSH